MYEFMNFNSIHAFFLQCSCMYSLIFGAHVFVCSFMHCTQGKRGLCIFKNVCVGNYNYKEGVKKKMFRDLPRLSILTDGNRWREVEMDVGAFASRYLRLQDEDAKYDVRKKNHCVF